MRTNDIHADHSEEQEQPQSNVQESPLCWAVRGSQCGESAEAAVRPEGDKDHTMTKDYYRKHRETDLRLSFPITESTYMKMPNFRIL